MYHGERWAHGAVEAVIRSPTWKDTPDNPTAPWGGV